MGALDQFAKETFAQETAAVTRGAAAWCLPPELNMTEVRLDGVLVARAPEILATLAAPWSALTEPGEVVVEIKMPGDHLDMLALDRAVLRRQARQVQRREDEEPPWDGEEALWMIAPHVPALLAARRKLTPLAPGVHLVGPSPFPLLWIAANDLPLADELVPFLVARTGRALDAFVHWVKDRRPAPWLLGARVPTDVDGGSAGPPVEARPRTPHRHPLSLQRWPFVGSRGRPKTSPPGPP